MGNNQIPTTAPYVPKGKPRTLTPPQGKEFPLETKQEKNPLPPFLFIKIHYSQYWKRIHWHDFSCGDTHAINEKVKTGVSNTMMASLSAELGVDMLGLSAKISATLSRTITINKEKEEEHKLSSKTAPKCGGVTLSVWQLIDKYRILSTKRRFFPVHNVTFPKNRTT